MWREVKKRFLIVAGFAVLGIGIVGIFVPLLPTTPLVLLAAWLFARSSNKYHQWLHSNRFFGETLRSWEAGEGLTVMTKWRMIMLSTVVIGISFLSCPNHIGRIVLILVLPIPICVAIFSRTKKS